MPQKDSIFFPSLTHYFIRLQFQVCFQDAEDLTDFTFGIGDNSSHHLIQKYNKMHCFLGKLYKAVSSAYLG